MIAVHYLFHKRQHQQIKMHKNWMQHQNEGNTPLEQLWEASKDYKQHYQPNVELGLSKLKERIAQDKKMPAPTKVIAIDRRQWLGRIAATVVFLVTCGFLLNIFVNTSQAINQLVTTNTIMENIVLPDGSTVWVNKHSQLSFPATFKGTERVVQLTGEAFFEVAKNPNQPFIVQLPNSEVKVLGTAFNVRAYSEEATTVIDVEEGEVLFMAMESKQQTILAANDKVVLNKADATLSSIQALDWKDTAWKAKQLNFENSQLISEVADYLLANFEVKLDFDKEKLGDCPFNATLVKNTPEAILKRVNSAFPSIELQEVHSKYYQLNGTCD